MKRQKTVDTRIEADASLGANIAESSISVEEEYDGILRMMTPELEDSMSSLKPLKMEAILLKERILSQTMLLSELQNETLKNKQQLQVLREENRKFKQDLASRRENHNRQIEKLRDDTSFIDVLLSELKKLDEKLTERISRNKRDREELKLLEEEYHVKRELASILLKEYKRDMSHAAKMEEINGASTLQE